MSQPFLFSEELLKINSTEIELMKLLVSPIHVKVNQSRYRPGVAQRVPGS